MSISLILLGGLLIGQTSGSTPPLGRPVPVIDASPGAAPASRTDSAPGASLAPPPGSTPAAAAADSAAKPAAAARAEERISPEAVLAKALVAECLGARTASTLKGRPTDLAAALANAADRKTTYEITLAYWRLVQLVADYNFWLDHDQQIEQLQVPQQAQMLRRTVAAGSTASLREAELAAMAAQHELAALAQIPVGALPLPTDRPHVGPYRTRLAEIFGAQGAPSRGRLLDQTLPLRSQAIEARTTAVDATREAQTAALDAYRSSQTDLATLLACLAERRRQSSAFMAAVYQYNAEIADYVLNVVPNSPTGAAVVSLLIAVPAKPSSSGGAAAPSSGSPDSSSSAAPRWNAPREGQPTTSPAAKPKTFSSGPPLPEMRPAEATPLPSATAPPPATAPLPTPPLLDPPKPGAAPPAPGASPPTGSDTVVPLEPIKKEPKKSSRRTVQRPVDESLGRMMIQPQALFGGLADKKPAVRAMELAAALHADRQGADSPSKPLALEESLRGRSAADRQAILTAYWKTRQVAAGHLMLVGQGEMLQGLDAVTGQRPWAAHRIRAAQLANSAARLETQAELLRAQADLADRLGLPAHLPLPMPSTIPHAGPYRLQAEQLPETLAHSRSMSRLVDLIPRQGEQLQDQAAAIVEADLMRAALTAAYETGTIGADQVLAAIDRQIQQTMTFLQAVTDYNCSIGQYVLAFLPPQVPGETLITTLVTPKSAKTR